VTTRRVRGVVTRAGEGGARARSWGFLLVLVLLPACGGDLSPTQPTDPAEAFFHPDLGVNLEEMTRTSSGLYLQDQHVGEGREAAAGDPIAVHYQGRLPSGHPFDHSTDGQPFEFTLGVGHVIPGWDEGLVGMREGGLRLLVVPPDLGYGSQPTGPIPPNSILVFWVQLVEVFVDDEEEEGASG